MQTKPLVDFISQSPEQTALAGEHLGAVCEGGEVILLAGALGAGKTVLAQGIARGLGVRNQVTSPTFTILKEYQGRLALYHFDFYRLENQIRDAEVEFAEYRRPDAVCVVEWAEHAPSFLPEEHLRVTLRFVSATKRALQLIPQGARHESLVRRFQALAFRL
jgi:tRNA threonylcarbamoyladenosine biosynthesis protein TsaE